MINITEAIRAAQKKLNVDVDGNAGPQTWQAIIKALDVPLSDHSTDVIVKADSRSEKSIATLIPAVKPYAYALIERAKNRGISIKIISGLRTYAEQDALYAQGRTLPGAIVTNAKGGYSNHNFAIAFDVGVFNGTKYLTDSPAYHAVGLLGVELGLEWGGNWSSFTDAAHFQLRPGWALQMTQSAMLAQLRERVKNGRDLFEE